MARDELRDAQFEVVDTLVRLRKGRGISQTELARRLGKTQQFVSLIEMGGRRITVVDFFVLAVALEVNPLEAFAEAVQNIPPRLSL